ncbi:coiled-coil-helix-coiled-coil-helix domain containing 6b isoform X4 [Parambassis ranga]|uniref:Coiled-coil-helix-coiled-coil-helix domain containing 6b isoform X4 n=1 Tax=Parambassis ranga TaxID=210632 RepID=A0A6P7I542_9TELE|nr:MICOS complex subunit mic25a-like isoform X4 [Parambassis ranga]
MGGNSSTGRNVTFGLDEKEKVTVIEGVKLSEDVLRRMREAQGSDSATNPPPSPPDSHASAPSPKPTEPSTTEIQEEMRKNFERQQALVEEQLVQLAQRERETAAARGLQELTPALIIEKGKAHEEQEKAKLLAKQLERKENELISIASFYKEQLETLEKKNLDNYMQTVEEYNQTATKAEGHIRPRQMTALCTELQARVLQCYRENPQQTLQCSNLAKQYMACVQQAKQSSLTNHG